MKAQYVMKMIKRALRVLPIIFVSMIFTVGIALGCVYAVKESGKIRVGVVKPKGDMLSAGFVGYIEEMESLNSSCAFVEYKSEEEGKELLEQGEITALVVVPKGLVEDVARDKISRLKMYLPDTATLETGIMKEITQALTSYVHYTKVGDNTVYDLYQKQGKNFDKRKELVFSINGKYMNFVISQEEMFKNRYARANDGIQDMHRYIIAGFLFLFLLLGIPAAGMVRKIPRSLEMQLSRKGIGFSFMTMVSVGLLAMCLYFNGFLALLAICKFFQINATVWALMVGLLIISITTAGMFIVFYTASKGLTGAVLTIFLTTVLQIFLMGGLIPEYMLPDMLIQIGDFLPAGLMMQVLWRSFFQGCLGIEVLWLFLYGMVFFGIAIFLRKRGGEAKG